MDLDKNGKYGTIEVRFDLPNESRFLATPAARKDALFPTAREAMDYLKQESKESQKGRLIK